MPEDDAWDWPILLYVGTVILGRSEKAFWRMTPRKLGALTDAHVTMNSSSEDKDAPANKAPMGYIDNVI